MKKIWTSLVLSFLMVIPPMAMAQGINACSLLTVKQVQNAIGVKTSQGRLTDMAAVSGSPVMAGKTLCHFESLDADHYRRYVSVDLTVKNSPIEAMTAFNETAALISSPEPVTGIGDKAIWSAEINKPFGGLHVVSGPYVLIIKIDSGKETANLKEAKRLAITALEKL